MSRRTRRRTGKARTEIIDTRFELYKNLTEPEQIERAYEREWETYHSDSPDTMKVIDVRRLEEERGEA
jgi:hypothetical protein